MAHKIQVKRGNKADLPTLDAGEFGLCQDTNELFIGNNGNQKIFPPTAVTAIVSLTAAGWVGDNAPYTRTYSNAAITATNPIELFAPPDITVEQLEALQAANIQGGTQSTGSIVLRAFGEKPAIDIPVGFIIRGDL
mgnify:CR=1 FL=1